MIEDFGAWSLTSDTFDISDWNLQEVMIRVRKRFVHPLITYTVGVDLEHNEKLLISLQPGDITFDPSDYENEELRETFIDYFTSVLRLLRGSENRAETVAGKIWSLEKRLAEIQDSEEVFTKSTVDDVQEHLGDWIDLKDSLSEFFNKTINGSDFVIYQTPEYFAHLGKVLKATPTETLVDYMVWRLVDSYAIYLTLDFSEAKLQTAKVTSGIDSIGPRWRFCFDETVNTFKFVTSALFVEEHFSKEDKLSANDIVTTIAKEFGNVLSNAVWLGEDVKEKALEKLDAMGQKIGYPDMIDNVAHLDKYYSGLEIKDDFFGNILNVKTFIVNGQTSRLGKPIRGIDRWGEGAKAHELSGFYNLDFNEMIFPASIFVQPLFDRNRPMALNFGGLGSIVGHEMTHGFDNKGSVFDNHGNLKNWWSKEALKKFQAKSECLISQYGRYQIDDVHVNGFKTLAENIADNGGIRVSFQAYQSWLEKHGTNGHEAMSYLPGLKFSEEQLFFLAFAQSYCSYSPSSQVVRELTGDEPHSPDRFRVLGPLSNMQEFSNAFNCQKGSPMNPTEKCRVW